MATSSFVWILVPANLQFHREKEKKENYINWKANKTHPERHKKQINEYYIYTYNKI